MAREPDWREEFDGDKLDETKWSFGPFEGRRRSAINSREMVRVKDGVLQIRTKTIGGQVFTGMISTQDKFERAYGTWEIKARFNDQRATWSDAWLYHPNVATVINDLNKGGMEIDIFEHRSYNEWGQHQEIVNHTLHWNSYEWPNHKAEVQYFYPEEFGGWHVFSVKTDRNTSVFSIDGEKTWESGPTSAKPLFLILSTEVEDKNWAGPIDDYDEITMEVDFVRFWEEKF